MANPAFEERADQIVSLLRKPPIGGPCEVIIDSTHNRIVVTTRDFEDEISHVEEGDAEVIAVISFPTSVYVG